MCGTHGMLAVIFDLDGVLVTTDRYHYRAWKELADGLGLVFNEAINHQLRGVSREASLRAIYRNNPGVALPADAVFATYCARKNARYVELLNAMTGADILPGAVRLLNELRQAGVRTAVASASKNAPRVLEKTGIAPLIDVLADGRDARNSKPAPDVFLLAAERLGLPPAHCVGVEDAASGVEAIRAAGMPSVGVGDQARAADVCVDSTDALNLRVLRNAWVAAQSGRGTNA